MNLLPLLLVLSVFSVSSCSIAPLPLDAHHPASATAPESSAHSHKSLLAADEDTRRTASQIAAREKQNSVSPSAPSEARSPKMDPEMPGMDMSH